MFLEQQQLSVSSYFRLLLWFGTHFLVWMLQRGFKFSIAMSSSLDKFVDFKIANSTCILQEDFTLNWRKILRGNSSKFSFLAHSVIFSRRVLGCKIIVEKKKPFWRIKYSGNFSFIIFVCYIGITFVPSVWASICLSTLFVPVCFSSWQVFHRTLMYLNRVISEKSEDMHRSEGWEKHLQ